MIVQCINIVDMANFAASGLLASKLKPFGPSCRWKSGSAAPQKRMPVATVVHSVILNHFHLLSNGTALGPPILMREMGENIRITTRITQVNPAKENSQSNVLSIQEFNWLAVCSNADLAKTEVINAAVIKITGGQKILWFIRCSR